jgi:hypothetical protein
VHEAYWSLAVVGNSCCFLFSPSNAGAQRLQLRLPRPGHLDSRLLGLGIEAGGPVMLRGLTFASPVTQADQPSMRRCWTHFRQRKGWLDALGRDRRQADRPGAV